MGLMGNGVKEWEAIWSRRHRGGSDHHCFHPGASKSSQCRRLKALGEDATGCPELLRLVIIIA